MRKKCTNLYEAGTGTGSGAWSENQNDKMTWIAQMCFALLRCLSFRLYNYYIVWNMNCEYEYNAKLLLNPNAYKRTHSRTPNKERRIELKQHIKATKELMTFINCVFCFFFHLFAFIRILYLLDYFCVKMSLPLPLSLSFSFVQSLPLVVCIHSYSIWFLLLAVG